MGEALPPDAEIVARLRAGDECTFAQLVDAWSGGMIRVARAYVVTQESAEDVVQETWLAVLSGIDRFAGRSSLRTWVHGILVNKAKTCAVRERRADTHTGPAVDPGEFGDADSPYPGHWKQLPAANQRVLLHRARSAVRAKLARYLAPQRGVV